MLFFLSGLPRSGSTVLAAILNQHPEIYVSPTSGLIELMGTLANSWQRNPVNEVQGRDEREIRNILLSVAEAKYEHIQKSNIIDKSRGWPSPIIMDQMEQVLGEAPKIIATVRPVADCAASFVRVTKPQNLEDFLLKSQVINHLKTSYMTLYEGWEYKPENFCMIEYDNLIDAPQIQLKRILEFLGISDFDFDFMSIEGSVVKERDEEVWNIPGLHDVKPVLERQHKEKSEDVLGDFYYRFEQPQFWKNEPIETTPNRLEKQFQHSLRGEFDEAWDEISELEKEFPNDNRVKFNKGWFYLHQGKLKDGLECLNFGGRPENAFGNQNMSSAPLWDGKSPCTVLLELEGGLGDQFHAVRYVKDIAARGCEVIISCDPSLGEIFRDIPDVKAIVAPWASNGIMHDMQAPSMLVPYLMGYEYKHISGKPYISKPYTTKNKKKKIGLRWSGNPLFTHEEYRRFPAEKMFDAVQDFDADFISLQEGENTEIRPEWVSEVSLENWSQTREAIASCDLVISSCTSVAHLSAAMGIETWIVVPVLSYFVWALPGDKSPFYDSVRLFRQTKFEDWSEPFDNVHSELTRWIENK